MITQTEGGYYTLTLNLAPEEIPMYQKALLLGIAAIVESNSDYGKEHPASWLVMLCMELRIGPDLLYKLTPQSAA